MVSYTRNVFCLLMCIAIGCVGSSGRETGTVTSAAGEADPPGRTSILSRARESVASGAESALHTAFGLVGFALYPVTLPLSFLMLACVYEPADGALP
jgi:hypothetical protein